MNNWAGAPITLWSLFTCGTLTEGEDWASFCICQCIAMVDFWDHINHSFGDISDYLLNCSIYYFSLVGTKIEPPSALVLFGWYISTILRDLCTVNNFRLTVLLFILSFFRIGSPSTIVLLSWLLGSYQPYQPFPV